MHNALELDAGRYVRGGASATILYATRLALRVGLYARAALAPEARGVRGLRNLPDAVRRELAEGSEALRAMVEQRALPVLQGWYGRLRRERSVNDACQVATHIAFVCGGVLEWGGELPTPPHGAAAGAAGAAAGGELIISQRQIFGLLSTRVYLNVNHAFDTDPPSGLSASATTATAASATTTSAASATTTTSAAAAAPAAKGGWPLSGRKGNSAHATGGSGGEAEAEAALGFDELEVFDLCYLVITPTCY